MQAERDLIYLGGFFDGEGSVTTMVNDRQVIIRLAAGQMYDQTPLHLLVKHLGGRIDVRPSGIGIWRVNGAEAYIAAKKFGDYTHVKRMEILHAITCWENRKALVQQQRLSGEAAFRNLRADATVRSAGMVQPAELGGNDLVREVTHG